MPCFKDSYKTPIYSPLILCFFATLLIVYLLILPILFYHFFHHPSSTNQAAAQVLLNGNYFNQDHLDFQYQFNVGNLIAINSEAKTIELKEGYIYLITYTFTTPLASDHQNVITPLINQRDYYFYQNSTQSAKDGTITNASSFLLYADQPLTLQLRFNSDDPTVFQGIGALSISMQASISSTQAP